MMQQVQYQPHIKDLCINWPLENLPKVCVISSEEVGYLNFYDLDDLCSCGKSEWFDALLAIDLIDSSDKVCLAPKKIQRCKNCHGLRLARIKDKFSKIMNCSENLLKNLHKLEDDNIHWLLVLKNACAKLELSMKEHTFIQNKNPNPYP